MVTTEEKMAAVRDRYRQMVEQIKDLPLSIRTLLATMLLNDCELEKEVLRDLEISDP